MRSQAASRSAPSSDSGRTRISLPAISAQTLFGFRAMLRNHAGWAAEPPAVPVTIQLVVDSASGKRLSRTWRRTPDRAPTVVTNSRGWPLMRMAVPLLRYRRTIHPAPSRMRPRMRRGNPVPRVPFGVTRTVTLNPPPSAARSVPHGRLGANGETSSEASDALGRPVARDHPPADGAGGDRPERPGVGAHVPGVPRELDRVRLQLDGRDALDELAGCVTRVGGQHDLPHPRPSVRVRPAFDEEPLSGEQRRGHRAALDLDDAQPVSRERDGGHAGTEREPSEQRRRAGPAAAPLRGHRSLVLTRRQPEGASSPARP